MNDNDDLNDSAVLSAVRDSISGVPLATAPRLEAITARGRARRACAALVAGLAGAQGSAGPAPQHNAPPIHLAAFSVVTSPDGATTLTLNGSQVINPNSVRQALAKHGIPALVTAGKFCRTVAQPAPGVGKVVSLGSPAIRAKGGPIPPTPGAGPGIVIYGSAIPRGVKLSIGYRQDPQHREISFTLIQAGAPLTCTGIPNLA